MARLFHLTSTCKLRAPNDVGPCLFCRTGAQDAGLKFKTIVLGTLFSAGIKCLAKYLIQLPIRCGRSWLRYGVMARRAERHIRLQAAGHPQENIPAPLNRHHMGLRAFWMFRLAETRIGPTARLISS